MHCGHVNVTFEYAMNGITMWTHMTLKNTDLECDLGIVITRDLKPKVTAHCDAVAKSHDSSESSEYDSVFSVLTTSRLHTSYIQPHMVQCDSMICRGVAFALAPPCVLEIYFYFYSYSWVALLFV